MIIYVISNICRRKIVNMLTKVKDQKAAEIGHRLRTVADELHMDTKMMCLALGNITRSTLSKYYTGDLHIPEDKLIIVRDVLHVNMHYLFTGDMDCGMFVSDSTTDQYERTGDERLAEEVDFKILLSSCLNDLDNLTEKERNRRLCEMFSRLSEYYGKMK